LKLFIFLDIFYLQTSPYPASTREHCKCVLTVEHILCTCTKYEHNWKQYFPYSQLSYMLLHSPKHGIFNYLTDINLLTKL